MIILGIDPGITSGWCLFDECEGIFDFEVGHAFIDDIYTIHCSICVPDIVIIEAANGEKGCQAAYVGGIWEGIYRHQDNIEDVPEFRKQYPAERRGLMPLASKITKREHARDAVSHVLAYLKKFQPKVFEKVREKYHE